MAKHHTFWFVTCLLIFQITALAEDTSAPVNARQVMLKFVESQKKLKSYIIKSDSKTTFSYTGFYNGNEPGTAYRHSDARFDGDRVKESLTLWGDLNSRELDVAKENADYISWLWDGETGYRLGLVGKIRQQTAKYPGSVMIHQEGSTYVDLAKEAYKRTMISPALGYVMGNEQDIGTMFLRADAKVKLLDKRSKVNGADCYVVEAEVPQRGKHKVWIDPVHGFNLARFQCRRETGDIHNGRPLKKDVHWNNFYEVIEFQEIAGVWLPKTFKRKDSSHDGGYGFDSQDETQTELYEVNLAPDHDKEGSFLTDDIPNGTQVRLEGVSLSVILTWQDGEVVDKAGKVVDLHSSKPADPDKPADPNQSAAGEEEAENTGTAQAQPGDGNKRLKKNTQTEDQLSVRELLERYATTQKQAFTSFIHKSETREDLDIHCTEYHGGGPPRIAQFTKYYDYDFRTDGLRIKRKFCIWGQEADGTVRSKDTWHYQVWVWDGGRESYCYTLPADISDPGYLDVDPNGSPGFDPKRYIQRGHVATDSWGYLVGDDERFDVVLLNTTNIAVRNKKEKIRRVSNYVIDAVTERGAYTVWIDPEHGYNFSKIIAHRQPGDKAFRIVLQPGEEYLTVVEVTKFQEIDGVWIPWETTMEDHRKYANGDYLNIKESFKVVSLQINPDHDALGSFLHDDIRNGASTCIKGTENPHKGTAGIYRYTWKDGKVVDKAGKVVMSCNDPNEPVSISVDETTNKAVKDSPSLLGKPMPELTEIAIDFNPTEVNDKSILFCFCDMNQRPSRHYVQELAQKAEELKTKGVVIVLVQTGQMGKKELEEWIEKYKIPFPIGMIKENTEKAFSTWGVCGQPWLILTDRQRVVRAEGFGVEELGEKLKRVIGE